MAFAFLQLASGLQLAPHAVLGPGLSISTDTVTANCAIPAGAELLRVEETAASVLSANLDGGLAAAQNTLAERLLATPALREALLESSDRAPSSERAPLHAWSDGELELLQSPALRAAALAARAAHAPDDALALVRQHAVVAGDELCLVPALARFARSAPTGATLTRCEATGDLVLLKDATSESVAVSSGWRTNDELLLTEGWADPALRSDAAALTLNDCVGAADAAFGAASAALRARQYAVLDQLRQYEYLPAAADAGLLVYPGGTVSDELGQVLQAVALTDAELEIGEAGAAMMIGEAAPLSLALETRVGVALAAACDAALAAAPTSLDDDEALLARGATDGRARQALHARLSRKRCLKACATIAQAWVERPTVCGASLRRPWKVHIRTSG